MFQEGRRPPSLTLGFPSPLGTLILCLDTLDRDEIRGFAPRFAGPPVSFFLWIFGKAIQSL